jgi:pimeloyl-ACP methyl ester carboxylesterase
MGGILMFGKVVEDSTQIGGSEMYYLTFGKGKEHLVIIPGLSEGLKTVKGTGWMMSLLYRQYAANYRIWIFSRRNVLPQGFTTRDMAGDLAEAMERLKLNAVRVMGVSQGGMIAQWLAIDNPDKVSRLVLVVSLARQNEVVRAVINSWIKMAEEERFAELTIDSLEKNYTARYLRRLRPFYWILRRIGKPESKERYLIQARSCLTHNAHSELSKIKSPTLVIGGDSDQIVGNAEVQDELATAIPGSQLVVYEGLGHSVYAEAKDFNRRVLNFLSNH